MEEDGDNVIEVDNVVPKIADNYVTLDSKQTSISPTEPMQKDGVDDTVPNVGMSFKKASEGYFFGV
ncbi:unnamed protein product, partial [Sphenostylis stenocarpa]